MSDLKAILNDPTRDAVVGDLTNLANETVSNQSGVTGMAIKGAVGAATRVDDDALRKGINQLLPNIVEELTPHWDKYQSGSDKESFGAYLAANEDEVTDSVLKIGDSFADRAPAAVGKVYSSLRGKVGKIVAPVLPEFGDIVERHAKG
ncbi:hypothetical protein KBX10_08885 [Corynebacterium sp. CCUG 59401]|nr:hypothetical protein [Corynebacterium pseudogenitalium]